MGQWYFTDDFDSLQQISIEQLEDNVGELENIILDESYQLFN